MSLRLCPPRPPPPPEEAAARAPGTLGPAFGMSVAFSLIIMRHAFPILSCTSARATCGGDPRPRGEAPPSGSSSPAARAWTPERAGPRAGRDRSRRKPPAPTPAAPPGGAEAPPAGKCRDAPRGAPHDGGLGVGTAWSEAIAVVRAAGRGRARGPETGRGGGEGGRPRPGRGAGPTLAAPVRRASDF